MPGIQYHGVAENFVSNSLDQGVLLEDGVIKSQGPSNVNFSGKQIGFTGSGIYVGDGSYPLPDTNY